MGEFEEYPDDIMDALSNCIDNCFSEDDNGDATFAGFQACMQMWDTDYDGCALNDGEGEDGEMMGEDDEEEEEMEEEMEEEEEEDDSNEEEEEEEENQPGDNNNNNNDDDDDGGDEDDDGTGANMLTL